MEYLDKNGLTYLWSKIKDEIESGGGASGVTMAEVEAKGYQTAAQVESLITTALGEVENGSY